MNVIVESKILSLTMIVQLQSCQIENIIASNAYIKRR